MSVHHAVTLTAAGGVGVAVAAATWQQSSQLPVQPQEAAGVQPILWTGLTNARRSVNATARTPFSNGPVSVAPMAKTKLIAARNMTSGPGRSRTCGQGIMSPLL